AARPQGGCARCTPWWAHSGFALFSVDKRARVVSVGTCERASSKWSRKAMRRASLALAVLVATAGTVQAQSDQQEALEILHARAPEMLDTKTVNVPVYMTIRNGLRKDERLLGASTPYADRVELIELRNEIGLTLPMAVDM